MKFFALAKNVFVPDDVTAKLVNIFIVNTVKFELVNVNLAAVPPELTEFGTAVELVVICETTYTLSLAIPLHSINPLKITNMRPVAVLALTETELTFTVAVDPVVNDMQG